MQPVHVNFWFCDQTTIQDGLKTAVVSNTKRHCTRLALVLHCVAQAPVCLNVNAKNPLHVFELFVTSVKRIKRLTILRICYRVPKAEIAAKVIGSSLCMSTLHTATTSSTKQHCTKLAVAWYWTYTVQFSWAQNCLNWMALQSSGLMNDSRGDVNHL